MEIQAYKPAVLVWLSYLHPTNSFVPIVIFYHAGGVQFYRFQQLTFFLRYDADLLIFIQ